MEDELRRKIASRGYVKDCITARAYQLDRDASIPPSLEDFLQYLEKRALALENAGKGLQQQSTKVTAVATAGATCIFYPVTKRAVHNHQPANKQRAVISSALEYWSSTAAA